jgi:hypothetical protein
MRVLRMNSIIAMVFSLALSATLCGCSGGASTTPAQPPPSGPPAGAQTASGYTLTIFAKAPLSTQHPDSIIFFNNTVYIGYQNAGDVKDGSNPALTNTIVQYDLKGNILKQYTVPGHNDGLMARSDTNELWAMSNEDGNPELTIINLASGAQNSYQATVNPTPHGGGYDDMQLLHGVVYVSASNPSAPGTPPPTLGSLTLNPNGTTFDVAPVLAGDAQALDITPSVGGSPNPTYNQMIPLALTDPDSLAIDSSGEIVLDSQADGKLVFISNPGPSQAVSVLTLTLFNDKDGPVTPVDDTRWVPSAGPTGTTFMLFTDATNTTYRLDASFKTGDAYSCAQGQVLKMDKATGHLTPVATSVGDPKALQDPHGMVFIAQ